MNSPAFIILFGLLWIWMRLVDGLSIAKILNATYPEGVAFSKTNIVKSTSCMCLCIDHPHCLSISVTTMSTSFYQCQLFATYPSKSSQLSSSLASYVTIFVNRTMSSIYMNNGTRLSNPTSLFSNTSRPWIPIFKLFTGNNQLFLGLNSSYLTTLTAIPTISIHQIAPHWYNVLLSQWNQNLYIPNQLAIAFIINRVTIIDFLVFNSTLSTTSTWFNILRLISNQYWSISQYSSTSIGQTQMTSIYQDNDCIRSLNCNFKYSNSGCTLDFYGYFFIYGGYKDLCIAAVRNMSKVSVPSIFYSPTINYTNGKLDYFNISDGIMGFVR